MKRIESLHLFCRVVDNFGDIGICWRLARQLQAEHGIAVTLWVDDLGSFQRICPDIATALAFQTVQNVAIRHWLTQESTHRAADIPDTVIEFFGCDLPPAYVAAMTQCPTPPVWINLEGLTAEDWVEGCHTLASPQARNALVKHFFYPGFTARTGGLSREAGLERQRQQFQSDPVAPVAFLAALGVSPAECLGFKVSLFCYPHAPLADLLQAWQDGAQATTCLVPEGVAVDAIEAFLGAAARPGAVASKGALTVRVLPFVAQDDYDRLLWACDLNFVRGEDSFVRAQWAGKPFIWHIYPQDENLHHKKLRAFLAAYAAGRDNLARLSLAWNGVPHAAAGEAASLGALWQRFHADLPGLASWAAQWERQMQEHGDLATNLCRFVDAIREKSEENKV